MQKNIINTRKPIAKAIVAASLLATGVASAAVLEEVIVTATKRAEGLQDVPIAISVVSGEAIEQKALTNMEDLAVYMPNVHVAEGSAGDQLFIRGIGSGINAGFEQSVGTFVDGVYYGRGRSARGKFLDLERVEVLKGPQSTLFGKNTIAGAINITTGQPEEEFRGYISASRRSEFDANTVTAMMTGSLSDSLRGRVAIRAYEDDGYIENRATGNDVPFTDSLYGRVTLAWDASEDVTATLKIEHGNYDVEGRQQVVSKVTPTSNFFYKTFGHPDFAAGFDYVQYDQSIDDTKVFDDTDSSIYQLTVEWDMGGHTLRSITALTEYEYENDLDSDYSPLKLINRGRHEEQEQFSQEFLLSSPSGETLEYLTGLYYQTEEINHFRNTRIAFSGLPPVQTAAYGLAFPAALVPTLEANYPGLLDGTGFGTFDQDSDTWSLFFEGTWSISDRFRVTAGLRYSDDQKDVSKVGWLEAGNPALVQAVLNMAAVPLTPDQFLAAVYAGARLSAPHSYQLSRDENHTTGHINFQWDVFDSTMLYLEVGNGYKAGGFDEDNPMGVLAVAEFEDETVDSVELGAKIDVADGAGRLNISAFRGDYKDVQVSTFDGTASFIVGNAAETQAKGVEADLVYAATDNLTINAAVAFLNAEYKSFDSAACTAAQTLAWQVQHGNRSCVQDLSGKQLQFAPDRTANIGLAYQAKLGDSLGISWTLDYNWTDDVVVANDLDSHLIQESFGKINTSISLSGAEESWQISLIGKNLNDEKTFTWGNDIPLGSFGFDGSFFRHIDPPRTVELMARYNF